MNTPSQEFRGLLAATDHAPQLCGLLLLGWLASCDEKVSSEESEILHELETVLGEGHLRKILALSKTPDVAVLHMAISVLNQTPMEFREPFLELAIGVAIADGRVGVAENHILRFLADALGLGLSQLESSFRRFAGSPLPIPGDPGNSDWWTRRTAETRRSEQRQDETRESRSQDRSRSAGTNGDMTRVRAMSILGLEGDEGPSEIIAAYRHLSNVHHPDRFSALGAEAVAVATVKFKRIQAAYEFLTGC